MEIDEFNELIDDDNRLINEIIADCPPVFDPEKYKQYDVKNHAVFSKFKRKDKDVFIPDPTGAVGDDGKPKMLATKVKVNRIGIPLQKLLVRRAAAFIVGGKVKLTANFEKTDTAAQKLYTAVVNVWKNNKLDFKNKTIVKRLLSETECAEIWYTDIKTVKGKEVSELKMLIVSPIMGNTLYPVFDAVGDMIAFGYSFETNTKKYFNLYTDKELRKYVQDAASGWVLIEGDDAVIELNYGKIPVIYYSQSAPFWEDVQSEIERLETLHSNHADTNDYNGSPILKLKGDVQGMAAKGEAGKAFQMDKEADVDYISWDSAPESIKMEAKDLRSWVFGGVQVPDLSPEFLIGLGEVSGAALDRILIDGHMMGKDYQDGVYGECLQRRNNFLVAALVSMDASLASAENLDVANEFTLFRINDEKERIENASLANGGKPLISQKSSVAYAGLTSDPEMEWELIQEEEDALANSSGLDN